MSEGGGAIARAESMSEKGREMERTSGARLNKAGYSALDASRRRVTEGVTTGDVDGGKIIRFRRKMKRRSGRTYGRTDGRTDGRTYGRTDGRTDGQTLL